MLYNIIILLQQSIRWKWSLSKR